MASALSLYPALDIRTPSIAPALQAYRTGADDARKAQQDNLLKQIGMQAAQGDLQGASNTAYAGGDLQVGSTLANMDSGQKAKALDWLARATAWADTPEKYEKELIPAVAQRFGQNSVKGFETFDKRDLALSLVEQAKRQIVTTGGSAPGSSQLGTVDVNAADPSSTFKAIGPERRAVTGTGSLSPYRALDPNNPSAGQEPVPGGPADPATVETKAAAAVKGQVGALADSDEAKGIADAIKSGDQPPVTTGLGQRMGPAVRAALGKDGFDLAKANLQWEGAKRQVNTLNSQRMVQYVSLAGSVRSTIDEVNSLADKLKNSGITILNRAKIETLRNVAGNTEQGKLASDYITAVNTLKEEFATLANQGFAPTESTWALANQQIRGDYGNDQLRSTLGEVKRLIGYRMNAISGLSTMGPGSANRYTGSQGQGGLMTPPPRTEGGMIPPSAVEYLKAHADDPSVVKAFQDKYQQPADAFLR